MNTDLIQSYLLYCIKKLKLTDAAINTRYNALKYYYDKVLHRAETITPIPRPKKASKLPKHIHSSGIKKMFGMVENLKHNTMLKLCYGMGLRVSEIVNIKISDVDSKKMQVHIRQAKGKKDRYANLPESILEQLRRYFKEYKPKDYLFEGQYGEQYSTRSVQAVFKKALRAAKINKDVGIHSLRHSYATHLMESGTEIALIQKLLDHKDIKTALIYAKIGTPEVKKVQSPLDKK